MNKVLEEISKIGIVPVIALDHVEDAAPLAKALCDGGLPCAEVTFRTAAAEESIRIMAEQFPEMLVGAGTVLTTEQVDRAVNAGAKFIVSPGLNPKVVKYCVEKGIPVTPGCSNPSDVEVAIELGLDVVAQPKIDVKSIGKGQDWTLTAEVVTKPEVKLGAYKYLEVSVEVSKEVTDEEVDAKLENERKNLAELIVKDGAAEYGDTVVIDFVGSVDGVEFDGGKGENHSLELGSGQFIPGFEDQLVGAKSGDEVEVKVTFPEDYQATDLAGKAAVFVTKVNEVKAKEVPALDDELAKDLDDEVDTLDELKAKYRKELEAAKEIAFDDAVEGAALDLAVENAEIVELPAEMVENEVHRAMNEFMGNLQRQGISPEMYFQITGTTQEDLRKQYEADSDKRVKTNLVIEAVAAAEGFDATDEEIQKEINDLAAEYNMEVSQVSELLSPEMLKHDIAMKKAVEVITSSAKVK